MQLSETWIKQWLAKAKLPAVSLCVAGDGWGDAFVSTDARDAVIAALCSDLRSYFSQSVERFVTWDSQDIQTEVPDGVSAQGLRILVNHLTAHGRFAEHLRDAGVHAVAKCCWPLERIRSPGLPAHRVQWFGLVASYFDSAAFFSSASIVSCKCSMDSPPRECHVVVSLGLISSMALSSSMRRTWSAPSLSASSGLTPTMSSIEKRSQRDL